jgi:hypothetical protein
VQRYQYINNLCNSLLGGFLSGGFCPGDFVWGAFVLDPLSTILTLIKESKNKIIKLFYLKKKSL